jgi:hypothetical protein
MHGKVLLVGSSIHHSGRVSRRRTRNPQIR